MIDFDDIAHTAQEAGLTGAALETLRQRFPSVEPFKGAAVLFSRPAAQ